MNKYDVQMALEGVAEARAEWSKARREFADNVSKVLVRLLHEAAVNYMSAEEFARHSGSAIRTVRAEMRRVGLDPREGKTLLAKHAAEALATNADLLGIAPHEMDLMSPLAYLPAGSELRQALTDKTVSKVTEFPETLVEVIEHAAITHCGEGQAKAIADAVIAAGWHHDKMSQ